MTWTVKGNLPHHFNTRENQNYVGPIPEARMLGEHKGQSDYDDFHKWHKEQEHNKLGLQR